MMWTYCFLAFIVFLILLIIYLFTAVNAPPRMFLAMVYT